METAIRFSIRLFVAFVGLSLLIGCKQAKEVAEIVELLADGRIKGPVYERLQWKAEDFYTDPGAISLCKAIQEKNIAEIDRIIKSGVDVNVKGTGNMTPLLWAFPMGEEVFGHILDLGADPNIKFTKNILGGFDKGTSVTQACVGEQIAGEVHHKCFYDVNMDNYLKLVLKHGGDPNQTNINGETLIFILIGFNIRDISERIHLLLEAGADINHRDDQGYTALLRTSSYSAYSASSALRLLNAGADYRLANNNGWDVIINLEVHKILDENGTSRLPPDPMRKELFDWFSKEGIDWEAARTAIESAKAGKLNFKDLPADFQHRPWLPQRPTLKKPDADKDNK